MLASQAGGLHAGVPCGWLPWILLFSPIGIEPRTPHMPGKLSLRLSSTTTAMNDLLKQGGLHNYCPGCLPGMDPVNLPWEAETCPMLHAHTAYLACCISTNPSLSK